jgi:16S rRNA (adenine1518-N6/adenine1519-N6)-dimethyltransferase
VQALKKGLGQHLLKDKNLLRKMVRLAGIGKDETVVEIGPGHGDLTACIAEQAHRVYAVELDEGLRPILASVEGRFPNVSVIFSDIRAVALEGLAAGSRIKVMGNIPYNITADILFKLLYEKEPVSGAFLTMQKEVAERLVSASHARSYGALSAIFQLYADMKILLTLKPRLFVPPPKVESAFIALVFRDSAPVDRPLVEFIKGCFRYKRKYLRHALQDMYITDEIDRLYAHMGFLHSVRAEEIEPDGFVAMYAFLRGVKAHG